MSGPRPAHPQAFVGYINHVLEHREPLVHDLFQDLRDCTVLPRFLAAVTGKPFAPTFPRPTNKIQRVENANALFGFLRREGVAVSVAIEDVVDGDRKATLALIYQLITKFLLHGRVASR